MISKGLLRTTIAVSSAIAATALVVTAPAPAALADSTRQLNLTLTCQTGLPFGLEVSVNGGGSWFSPAGSSFASGNSKIYNVAIPASATSLEVQPTFCDNQLPGNGPNFEGNVYSITPGPGNLVATGNTNDFTYSPGFGQEYLLYVTSLAFS
jgi:hypothetical protein